MNVFKDGVTYNRAESFCCFKNDAKKRRKSPSEPLDASFLAFFGIFSHVSAENGPDLAENVTRTPSKVGKDSLKTLIAGVKF